MIEGLLRHGTDAGIEANYTDTHGASLVGFAFTELLGFKRLPGTGLGQQADGGGPAGL